MNDLLLVEKRLINNVLVDGFYRDKQALFNRFQIGSALEYTDPAIAIAKIHKRHKERLDQFSFLYQIGKGANKREMVLYTTKGVLEICRWSNQPKANEVMDRLYDYHDSIMRKGYYSTMTDEQLYELLGKRIKGNQEVVLREYERINPSTIKSVIPLSVMTERVVVKKTEPPVYPTI